MNKNTYVWLHGLIAALVGGSSEMLASSLGLVIIAPEKFEIGPQLWKTLLVISVLTILSGAKVAAAYLKTSPIPAESIEIQETKTTTVTATPTDKP